MAHYDVVVCGLGAMGSAALAELARRGCRVLGIERFTLGHDRGSSHGATRIIRLAYFEHPSYVPLLHRAYALWRDLERAANRPLLHITGIVEIGPPDGSLVTGTLAAARLHGLDHELLAASEVMRRFPAFRLPSDFVGVMQRDGGFVEAEPSIHAMMTLAAQSGAEIRTGETVRAIEPRGDGVTIVTERGPVDAGAAIVATGPWMNALLPDLPLRVTRQAMGWFAPRDQALFAPERFPVFLIESRHGIHYGIPPFNGGGMKVARHYHRDETVEPDTYDRAVSAADEAAIRVAIEDFLPAADGPPARTGTCLYTMAPDGHFIVDRLTGAPGIVVASACSGHGFKFAPVIGQIVADLATRGTTEHDISRFGLGRFG
ncbi:MAG: N-methyl-L-tryptophan oxidase [Xanthobacteraceae bacterium]